MQPFFLVSQVFFIPSFEVIPNAACSDRTGSNVRLAGQRGVRPVFADIGGHYDTNSDLGPNFPV